MNKILIIGNLTRDPEERTTPNGYRVCSFTVAVNRKKKQGNQEADFFRVSAWNDLGETCGKYLAKGRKVAVTGSVQLDVREYNGKTYADMAVTAESVEFLSGREQQPESERDPVQKAAEEHGFIETQLPEDELPF